MTQRAWKGARIDGARDAWWVGLRAPLVAAPMFRVTTPELVLEATAAGLAAVLPAHNLPTTAQLDDALGRMAAAIAARSEASAPWGVNLIAHATNPRFQSDLAVVTSHRCPLVVASVGSPRAIVEAVHAYGGRVWCDVISLDHARKAVSAGVDGLVLVCSGAGGNTGWINPLAFLKEVRRFYGGVVAVSGAITDGARARALELLGADLAYLGTPFITTHESAADDDYKDAVANGALEHIVLTKAASGIPANLLKESLRRMGLDPNDGPSLNVGGWTGSAGWSAGHGIGCAGPRVACRQLANRLIDEYDGASMNSCTTNLRRRNEAH
jgi:nitronate monooxygenase